MKKCFAVIVIAILLCCCGTGIAEEDAIMLFKEFTPLWGIPFGLTKEETIQRFSAEKGITLVESSVEPAYAPDSTFLKLSDDQEFTLLGYKVSLSVTTSKAPNANDQKYSFESPVYCFLSINFDEVKNTNKNLEYIKEGQKQLSTVMDAFGAKYCDPTYIYYSTLKDDKSEWVYHIADADFLALDNILNLWAEKYYAVGFTVYYNNIYISTHIYNSNWHTYIYAGTTSSNCAYERMKDQFHKEEQKPDPVELGL